jgi:flavodoxin
MSKIAVVFWSGTGNTAAMAQAVEAGAKEEDPTRRYIASNHVNNS